MGYLVSYAQREEIYPVHAFELGLVLVAANKPHYGANTNWSKIQLYMPGAIRLIPCSVTISGSMRASPTTALTSVLIFAPHAIVRSLEPAPTIAPIIAGIAISHPFVN